MSAQPPFPTEALLRWYDLHKRDLPWRSSEEPYGVLVSEVMLHQTQVTTVIPYYQRFLERFPTVFSLAGADDEEVARLWKGLGYYRRAHNLQAAARQLAANLSEGLGWPKDAAAWQLLPGVGAYTSAVMASITSKQAVPALDANVLRIMARFLACEQSIASAKQQRQFHMYLQAEMASMASERPGDFNQALMELGECLCIPKRTECLLCPLSSHCQGYKQGNQLKLPVRAPQKSPRSLHYLAYVLLSAKGIAVETRQERMLHHQWQFPMQLVCAEATVSDNAKSAMRVIANAISMGYAHARPPWVLDYRYTHQLWHMQPCIVHLSDDEQSTQILQELVPYVVWCSISDLTQSQAPLIRAHQKVLERLVVEGVL